MIRKFFPNAYDSYLALPVLGVFIDEFSEFLSKLEYGRYSICRYISMTKIIDLRLRELDCSNIIMITRDKLKACALPRSKARKQACISAAISSWVRFFNEKGMLLPLPVPTDPIEKKLIDYRDYLLKIHNFAPTTIRCHNIVVSQFLNWFDNFHGFEHLTKLTSQDIEYFICDAGNKVGRSYLQNIVTYLRSFLRFLAHYGEIPQGLDNQIDTPRVYHGEKLPRALDWKTVCALLKSVDRSTAIGTGLCSIATHCYLWITR